MAVVARTHEAEADDATNQYVDKATSTGGLRRVYLRGRENVYKRVLIHLGGFNLSLLMRQWSGKGTPRGWQGIFGRRRAGGVAILDCDPVCHTGKAHHRRRPHTQRSCASPL